MSKTSMKRSMSALMISLALLLAPRLSESQPKVYRAGYLSLAPGPSPRSEAFRDGLRETGYTEGQNLVVEYRWADGSFDRALQGGADLLRLNVDVIVTGGPQATLAAKQTTITTPIVMAFDYDPVGSGFVASLARPGGNVTGLSGINPELSGKRLELLKQVVPRLSRVAVLWNPAEPNGKTFLQATEAAAMALRLQLQVLDIRAATDIEPALRAAGRSRANGLTVLTDPVTLFARKPLAAFAAKYRLPAIYSERLFVETGGLMSYGTSDRDMHRRAAAFVDKILKGAKPADLPVEQPTKFELVINLKTATAPGVTIPQSLLIRADEVIR